MNIGQALPALILQDGEISLYGLAWARDMVIVGDRSPSHVMKAVMATGRFYDFYIGVYGGAPLAPNEMSRLMRQFYEARALGNKVLGWKPAGKRTAKSDVRYASEFSKFCAGNFGFVSANPVEKKLVSDLNVSEQLLHYQGLNSRKEWNLLLHLTPTTDVGRGKIKQYSFTPQIRPQKQEYCHNYFPPEKVLPFLAAVENLRDLIAFLILFFGGLRISELLHIYVTDITAPHGLGNIKIAHPELSQHSWDDKFRGHQEGNRSQFLSERYGLTARNKLGLTDPLHAGWKGMNYTEGNYRAGFYWLLPEIEFLFAELHHRYLNEFRVGISNSHPYYFVNFQNENYGSPLKISNLTKSFYRAAERIGLKSSDRGVNPHGARHFYGHFCASYLKLPMEQTQIYLRHVQLTSTQVYYSIDPRIARAELIKGHERLKEDIPEFLNQIASVGGKI
ncbi:Tyrosine recombinase XerC [compost metagenome]